LQPALLACTIIEALKTALSMGGEMGSRTFAAAVILAWGAQAALAASEATNEAPTAARKAAPQAAPARPAGPTQGAAAAPAGGITRVADTDRVCMMNDRYMGTVQIPVDVKGKRYYGCCAMCKERLARDRRARVALDPVSGKEVDKATALIGRRADGSVLYFENEANLEKYRAR
jgi:YHS domain-containing protein